MERVGEYELLSLIGEGGMGEVWRARDLRHDRDVALKLLPDSLCESEEYRHRFRRESHLVARLREPHLIPIHDFGEIDGRLFLDMRLVEGRSLQDLLDTEGALSAHRTVAYLAQIADALDAAHADGLVHRDVKPSNVLVTPSDFVYVVDFGLAHPVGSPHTQLTQAGVAIGTLEYMAPERFAQRPVDARTDVYSLACVLFECLTDEKPFPGDLPTQMYGHLTLDPPRCSERRPGVSAAFDAVVARGMAKAPEDRFATAGELVAAARVALRAAAPARRAAGAVRLPADAAVTTLVPGAALAVATPSASRAAAAPPRPPVPGRSAARDPHPSGPTPGAPLPELRTPPPVRRRRRGLLVATAGATAVVLAVVVLLLTVGLPGATPAARPTPRPASPTPTVVATVPVGSSPVAMQVAPDGRFAYVANRDAGTVTVFDVAAGAAVGTIPVPGSPQALAFSPDGAEAYVALLGAAGPTGEVVVVDTASGTVTARVPTGSRPAALAVAPDGGRVYASDPDGGSVTVVDPGSDAVVDRIAVGAGPHGLAVSPDGTRLAVTNDDADRVTVVDAAGGPPTPTPVGRAPHAVAWHPTEPWLLVADFAGNGLSVVDAGAGRVLATVPTAVHPQAVAPSADGRYAYVAAIDANVVQVVDPRTATVTATIPTGRAPSAVAVTPDGRTAYVTDLLDATVTVLRAAS
ncbi:hypothetical protein GCM10023201_31950 [Actinomycetospora corticicola]|uniref:non-specific serine/threonine protein kinase n=1 Tax=Actinomycetospora corticicola TaxID=663602 RepID=A0A7Y9DV27_9PSEU|nr:serine/threonine-protein kinase [Actinomycetospora corticicola]NYD35717.1 serine/threonine-protein kinase [Actinomycetospora corticicola]